mgnify:CR=1 FL=1
MGKRVIQTEAVQQRDAAPVVLPSGTPTWITPELVELTQKVWQPYYDTPLTPEDAITILRNASGLLDTLTRR